MVSFPKIEEIKGMRKKSGLSQKELAKAVSVSQSAIAKYENGTQIPSYTVAVAIFNVLLEKIIINEPKLTDLNIPKVVFAYPDDTLESAMKLMKDKSISQIPVKTMKGLIIGTINESKILEILSSYHTLDQFKMEKIENQMDAPLPIIPGNARLSEISSLLKRYSAVLINDTGKVNKIITKSDLLDI